MSFADFLLPILIAVSAVFFGLFTGRAEAARMRELRDDVLASKPRGYLVILAVVAIVFATHMTRQGQGGESTTSPLHVPTDSVR